MKFCKKWYDWWGLVSDNFLFIIKKKIIIIDIMLNDLYWKNFNLMILENNLKKNLSNLFKKIKIMLVLVLVGKYCKNIYRFILM